jgi:uncharacterized protein YndB with AHSA1/START domain
MIEHTITIDASREKVWNVLWADATYRKWSAAFMEGSHIEAESEKESDWKEGSKILFLGPDKSGMTSVIAAKRPNEFMSFRHMGVVSNGVEDTESEEARKWRSSENYTLEDLDGKTGLTVTFDGDIPAEYVGYFNTAWPKALQTVKELAEGHQSAT